MSSRASRSGKKSWKVSSNEPASVPTKKRQRMPADGLYFACNLCHKTVMYRASMRRHLFMTHRIEVGVADAYYEVRTFLAPPPPPPTSRPSDNLDANKQQNEVPSEATEATGSRAGSKRRTNCRDVGCEATCLKCEKWKKKAQELEKLLDDVLQDGEKVKDILARIS